jgi:transcriptional regulator with XRE-family HTH domain
LAAARRKANLTQVELAALLGKPQSVVSGYEAGKRRVDVVEFLLIARTLGGDPVEVFTEIAKSLSSFPNLHRRLLFVQGTMDAPPGHYE